MGRQGTAHERRRQETRERLVASARTLFGELGYTGAGAEAIARSAGVSRATFYLHFKSKAELVTDIMHTIEPEIIAAYRSLDELVGAEVDDVIAWLEQHAEFWRAYSVDFAAIQQALAHEPAVADEWFGMLRRAAKAMGNVRARFGEERSRALAHVLITMMALDRTYYFLLLRGHDEFYGEVQRALAENWLALLNTPPEQR
ncbi:TetR family transcriptional regulator [Halopolyspora algeriensis]|uniref:TetR family transcriptional regulator n=1 Tax=Halopolyspora algeriensis TaxID=1500506 RepID=A0A368VEI1_9ACTN|nr:TetR/AcrR family transcriptional regulator [Halopolyspora algeriensis]RCW39667.1 TetR family transcriptional regulator [Halopolyspora algeriensis]TQM54040.1 TetR family transcriptional regulator [Halopolyspora algeriensis]